ncbi:glutamyl-tRNA reductase [Nonomuraea roseoviolacea subsp. roseoviolacea]|uniref:Glutamyl-tRNA reductase n=1 Tax=Nonomuraea roseoviolacea subsp. carminata TaxID=160689 RepID=A0ABT1JYW7_9ACTN|nr:glutamyl-tRNA reductase [Nonomuraea roseoviolacea]MCP2346825.1 glutamyl-tRNA reductase [Nonomuraea roseoviolacea subsp. carminata]
MSILAIGLSHRTAPVAMLERVSLAGEALVKLLHDVQQDACVAEAMVVSTCNRVEVYTAVDRFHAAVTSVCDLLSVHTGVAPEELKPHLYVHYEERAVEHLFSVVCGLESMVVGEGQILGQVRQALKLAQKQGTVGAVLNELTQQALRVGKRAHTDTGIDKAGASLVSAGLTLAGELPGRRALVIGAGSMSSLAATTLARAGVTDIVVANRTFERGRRLAESVGGRAVEFSAVPRELAAADIVITCTGAGHHLVTPEMLTRGAFLLDLALPHDIDPAVRSVPGVTLVDLETIQESGIGSREGDAVRSVRELVSQELTAYLDAERAAKVTPTVVALRGKAASVVEAELGRLMMRIPGLDAKTRDEVALTVQRVVDKLLHEPTVRVKQLATSPGGDHYAEALRELFDLDPSMPEAVREVEL